MEKGYVLFNIKPVENHEGWFYLQFRHTDGSFKNVTVENISGLKDVQMTGLAVNTPLNTI